jgi:hypothetical protein
MKMLFYMKMYLHEISYPIWSTNGHLEFFWIRQIQNRNMSFLAFSIQAKK